MRSSRSMIRLLLPAALLLHLAAPAQPQPPGLCFVLAEDRTALRPLQREVQVVQCHRQRISSFGVDDTHLGPLERVPLRGGRLFSDTLEQ